MALFSCVTLLLFCGGGISRTTRPTGLHRSPIQKRIIIRKSIDCFHILSKGHNVLSVWLQKMLGGALGEEKRRGRKTTVATTFAHLPEEDWWIEGSKVFQCSSHTTGRRRWPCLADVKLKDCRWYSCKSIWKAGKEKLSEVRRSFWKIGPEMEIETEKARGLSRPSSYSRRRQSNIDRRAMLSQLSSAFL